MIAAFLDEPAERSYRFARSLIFQHGVTINRVLDNTPGYFAYRAPDLWVTTGPKASTPMSLSELVASLNLQIVALEFEDAYWTPRRFVRSSEGSGLLEMQAQAASNRCFEVAGEPFLSAGAVAYVMRAVVYHLTHLVTAYTRTIADGTRGATASDNFIFATAVRQYFDLEALVSTCVQAYDTTRFLVWAKSRASGTMPSNLSKTIDKAGLPDQLSALWVSQQPQYNHLKGYRHCLHHYASFGARLPFARLHVHNAKAWAMTSLLPDNSEARSYRTFTFDKSIDALTFGWFAGSNAIAWMSAVLEHARLGNTE